MTIEIHGTCDEAFEPVRATFESNFAQGLELGASVAVVLDGELVVDLWAGDADPEGSRPWERDTIVNVFSSTKPMAAMVVLSLVDEGLVDLDAPVAAYWPEFAANGKDAVLVRHVLGHTAGLCAWTEPITSEQLYDLPLATERLAAQAPLWEPGTVAGYHAITQGHLLGEIVRRVSGESLGQRFRTEFAEPLGADFHIGVGPEIDDRIATIVPPPFPLGGSEPLEPGSIAEAAFTNPVIHAEIANTDAFRRVELPACNGHGNARSIARAQSVVSHGGVVDGRRYLSEAVLERIFDEQFRGIDVVQEMPVRLGIGYGINGDEVPVSPNPRACYWGGWGGSVVLNDLDARMTFAYAMNKMGQGIDLDVRGVGLGLMTHQVLMSS